MAVIKAMLTSAVALLLAGASLANNQCSSFMSVIQDEDDLSMVANQMHVSTFLC